MPRKAHLPAICTPVLVVSLFALFCSQPVPPVGPNQNGISRDTLDPALAFIQLPACIASEAPVPSKLDSAAVGLYANARMNLAYISDLVNETIVAFVDNYYNRIPHDTIVISDNNRYRIRLWLDSVAAPHTRMRAWMDQTVGMELTFSRTAADAYNGSLVLVPHVFDANSQPGPTVRLDFMTMSNSKQMSLWATDANAANESDAVSPRHVFFTATEISGVVSYRMATYHQVANEFTGAAAWCSVVRGKADRSTNTASLELALPPASLADSTAVFSGHGAEAVMSKWVTAHFDSMVQTDTVLAGMIYACTKYGKALPLNGAVVSRSATSDTVHYLCYEELDPYIHLALSIKDSLVDAMVFEFLSLNRGIAAWRAWDDNVQTAKPPVYMNTTQFLGCGSSSVPSGIPAGLGDLSALTASKPAGLATLTISFESTAPPDF